MEFIYDISDLQGLNDIYYISSLLDDFVEITCLNDESKKYLVNSQALIDYASENVIVPTGTDFDISDFNTFDASKTFNYLRGVVYCNETNSAELITLDKSSFSDCNLVRCLGEFVPISLARYLSAYNSNKERNLSTIFSHPLGIVFGRDDSSLYAYCGQNRYTCGNQANIRNGKFRTNSLDSIVANLNFNLDNDSSLTTYVNSFMLNNDLCYYVVNTGDFNKLIIKYDSKYTYNATGKRWYNYIVYDIDSNTLIKKFMTEHKVIDSNLIYEIVTESSEDLQQKEESINMSSQGKDINNMSLNEQLGYISNLELNIKAKVIADEIGKVIKPLLESKSEDDVKIAEPEINNIDFSKKHSGLDEFNINSCLDTLRAGKIPVLVGWAGAGKTYTVKNMHYYIAEYYRSKGKDFDEMVEIFIPCSNISHNDFWGSFDAVSHTCIGKFKYIWLEAEKNPNILYYVILDEMLDMTDIRKTFGDSFSKLTSLPENMIVVATGNKSVYDSSNETARNMLKDDGILGRFELIEVKNILENPKSEMYNIFFDNIKTPTELSKYLKNLILHLVDDEHFKDMMLIPRKVEQFIDRGNSDISVTEFQNLLKDYIRKNPRYLQEILFVKKPEKASSEATEMLDLVENIAYDE